MSNHQIKRREAIRRTLLLQSVNAHQASAIADAVLEIWQQMAARLEPVVGARGVDVLFGRALQLTTKEFPWLKTSADSGNSAASLTSIRNCLEARDKDVAAEVGLALIAGFTELLAGLIGEPLTDRLLDDVWAVAGPVPKTDATRRGEVL